MLVFNGKITQFIPFNMRDALWIRKFRGQQFKQKDIKIISLNIYMAHVIDYESIIQNAENILVGKDWVLTQVIYC